MEPTLKLSEEPCGVGGELVELSRFQMKCHLRAPFIVGIAQCHSNRNMPALVTGTRQAQVSLERFL
jgi:hypothetical protein